MKKAFVFCIGGTGLRVMKSIVMMLASGMDTNGHAIVPILVDPHQDLDEKKNLQSLIDLYRDIYNRSTSDGNQSLSSMQGFFPAPILWLSALDDDTNNVNENIGIDKSFESYLGLEKIDTFRDTNKYLIDTLFSNKSKRNKLSVGFKGNPNVGTVVLGDIIEGSSWFDSFKRHCEKDDRVFIVSSIFGGTGASGFPLIEKKIREADSHPAVKNVLLGASIVMPYYGLKDPTSTDSDIDSANFYTKTKAALSYYEGKIVSDYVYYVGETRLRQVYENNEAKQRDTANFIELVSASSFFDFLKQDKPECTQYMSRAIESDEDSLDKDSLGKGYAPLVKAVADFNLLIELTHVLPKEKYFPLKVDRGLDQTFYKDQSFTALDSFIKRYEQWYHELATNKRAFTPLNIGTRDLRDYVKGMSLDAKAKDDSYYLLRMIEASHADKQNKHQNKFRYFLEYTYQAIDYYTKKILE